MYERTHVNFFLQYMSLAEFAAYERGQEERVIKINTVS
jgi:hypothetical protein